MNGIDIAIAGILVIFAIRGFIKGFLLGLASLAGLILGIFAAYYFSDYTREMLEGHVSIPPDYIKLIAFILTFVLVLLLIHLIARLIEKIGHYRGYNGEMSKGLGQGARRPMCDERTNFIA